MQQWEYEVQDFYGAHLPKEYLNGFGHNGWDLLSSELVNDPIAEIGGTKHYFLIFKRPKQKTDS